MKVGLILASTAVLLVGCGSKADEPSKEQMAQAVQVVLNQIANAAMGGQKAELKGWDSLTYKCEPTAGETKTLNCTTGGEITIEITDAPRPQSGDVVPITWSKSTPEAKKGPHSVPARWIITMSKTDAERWTAVNFEPLN